MAGVTSVADGQSIRDIISDYQWRKYEEQGYINLGKLLSDRDLEALRNEIDAIMLGTAEVDFDRLLMQLDSETGKYEDAGVQSLGHKGSTLRYRKIQNLEHDPIFREYLERTVFAHLSARVYGAGVPISCFRAMFMNKPARQGTLLPWHQDAWAYLDRQPLITVWTALDPATKANGCVQVIPGSHQLGRINPDDYSGYLTAEQVAQHCPDEKVVFAELEAGEVLLLHNWLMHRSDTNATDLPRRAFSVCYMDGRTVASNSETFTPLFS
jgi:phytanoyl-CoA hydroxylase